MLRAPLVQNSPSSVLPTALLLRLPGGQSLGPPEAPVQVELRHWSSLAKLKFGRVGALAEDYVEGKLGLHGSMRDVMAAMVSLLPGTPVRSGAGGWTRLLTRARSIASHTPQRDAAQIQFHYDVSDAFYALWLDARRVYSCAYWRNAATDLAQAQEAKLEHICRKLMLRPGERFLDIGAGWGALLLWAAERHGVDATGITLSRNQHAHVNALIRQKGLQGRVRMELLDYRQLDERLPFDKIASVGMFEHVGQAQMQAYFSKVCRLLKPGGLVMNHGITAGGTGNRQLGAGMGNFIEKYIFPGGELSHVSAVLGEMTDAGLEMVDTENLRPHYARTLWSWSDALESRLDEARHVLAQGGGAERAEKTLRAYRLYLAGCAMSFEQGWVSLHQMLAIRPSGQVDAGSLRGSQSIYPFQRDYMYASA
jgi:cyclopropane-fatty-acyl-phospholipid synthase